MLDLMSLKQLREEAGLKRVLVMNYFSLPNGFVLARRAQLQSMMNSILSARSTWIPLQKNRRVLDDEFTSAPHVK